MLLLPVAAAVSEAVVPLHTLCAIGCVVIVMGGCMTTLSKLVIPGERTMLNLPLIPKAVMFDNIDCI